MKINNVSVFAVSMVWKGASVPTEDRQVVPLDMYPEFNLPFALHPQEGSTIRNMFVEVKTDEGIDGLYGPIDSQQAFIIHSLLAPFLQGKDPLAIEALHDQMLRMHRHGRTGLFCTGLSAVDLALWDLKGKVLNLPVYRLLGGPTRSHVPAYASMLGSSTEPALAARKAVAMKAEGYTAQKWFFRHGPGSGEDGMRRNLAMAFAVREAVGPDYPIAFDAFNGWTEPYAIEMMRKLEPMHPLWMEEPIPPERISSLAAIRAATRVPLATGEHTYTRWQVKELLTNGAVDYVQTDPDWTGGITEQMKICALASSFDIPVVAHGHALLPPLHIAAAQPPAVVPMVENLVNLQAVKQVLFKDTIAPENGLLRLPQRPGLGLEIDESKIDSREDLTWNR